MGAIYYKERESGCVRRVDIITEDIKDVDSILDSIDGDMIKEEDYNKALCPPEVVLDIYNYYNMYKIGEIAIGSDDVMLGSCAVDEQE